mgnify:FL=1
MAKSKKRFKIIDKGNHVIKKDLMTSTVYSCPKKEDSNEYNYYPRSKLEKLITDFVVEHNLDAQFVQQMEGLTYVRFVVEEDEDDE